MNLYDDLGLSPDADASTISAAYRGAAKRAHPDVGGDRASFERIKQAHHVLSDPQRRARYDATGEIDDTLALAEAKAAKRLLQAMVRKVVTSGIDLGRHDFVGAVLAETRAARAAISAQATEVEAQLARVALASSRLSRTGDQGEDVLTSILREEAQILQQVRPRLSEALRTHDTVAALLNGYSYRAEGEGATISFIHDESGLNVRISRRSSSTRAATS